MLLTSERPLSPHLRAMRGARLRAFGGWLLVLALLWAPTLGALHRQLHAHSPSGVSAVTEAVPQLHRLLGDLFGHHSDSPNCPLFDQCASGDALVGVLALALSLAPPLYWAVPTLLAQPANPPAFYDARGPPQAR